MDLLRKLEILADAAKYDASCASSGTDRRHSAGKTNGIGSTEGMGICHAYAPDGRCISLLKILLTNACIFDCAYCINRRSSNVQRARFSVDEIVQLTIGLYKRNCIEGLFLSSGIIRDPNYTMEQVIRVARRLREQEGFRGYIHLKTIPDADPVLLDQAGLYADRLSINVELPDETSLARLAPEKDAGGIRRSMGRMRLAIEDARDRRSRRFAPAGQSTQLIVGADATDDRRILSVAHTLYGSYGLRRVYYSAFSPIPDAAAALPLRPAPLLREHRLYQADWLLRFYGFALSDIITEPTGNLALTHDPKLAYAYAHPEAFPVDINRADKAWLLRIPGLGVKSATRVIAARRHRRLRLDDLARLGLAVRKLAPFIITADHFPRAGAIPRPSAPSRQPDLFQ